jgi:hypothetical protein
MRLAAPALIVQIGRTCASSTRIDSRRRTPRHLHSVTTMTRSRAVVLALLVSVLSIPSPALRAQGAGTPPNTGGGEGFRRGGGGNTDQSPFTYKTWKDAESDVLSKRSSWRSAKQRYDAAQSAYDTKRDAGGGSPDLGTALDALRRAKDDAYRTEHSFRVGYQRAARGAVNVAASEMKAATTDDAKKAAAAHQRQANTWKGEAEG